MSHMRLRQCTIPSVDAKRSYCMHIRQVVGSQLVMARGCVLDLSCNGVGTVVSFFVVKRGDGCLVSRVSNAKPPRLNVFAPLFRCQNIFSFYLSH
jgi:hypothetical protein